MKSVFPVVFSFTVMLLSSTVHGTVSSGTGSIAETKTIQGVMINASEDLADLEYENHAVRYDSASLDSFIRDYMNSAHIPGLATWCFKNGSVIWQQNYGYSNLTDSIEVTDTTKFNLGSIPKTITETAIMQLWERGRFDLDDDVNEYLDFTVRNPNYPDSAITFLMLMTHMSSIFDNESVLWPLWQLDSPVDTAALAQFMYDYLDPAGVYYTPANYLTQPPGSVYSYSSIGAALLGYLVEVLDSTSFPVHVQDSILIPLGMHHSNYYLAGADTTDFATGYHWSGSAYMPCQRWSSPWYPAGGVHATAGDLGRFLTAIYQYGVLDTVRILDSLTVVEMLTPRYEYTPGIWICLIWFRTYMYNRWICGINGRDVGFDAFMAFCRDENSAIIALANCDSSFCTWAIGGALFDYAEQYGVEEHGSLTPKNIDLTIHPNPFSQKVNIEYSTMDASNAELKIRDVSGRLVKKWFHSSTGQAHQISWDGRDDDDRMLPAGVYFVNLEVAGHTSGEKLLLVK